MAIKTLTTAVIVPNWNGIDDLPACLDSLLAQTVPLEVVVVENGSTDGSLELLAEKYPTITVLAEAKNHGFAGGVNIGLRYALEKNYPYAALFNNDAVAEPDWLEKLVATLEVNKKVGIVASKFMTIDKKHLDSTGDQYTSWGLPYPRGRSETNLGAYDKLTEIFGASGGSSLYRTDMLRQIGLFDEDFFAYYEDVDISWRAQLAGWKVAFAPKAVAYHKIGATSGKVHGFTTLQTLKNLPWVFWKNVPSGRLFWTIGPRLLLAYTFFFWRAVLSSRAGAALKGFGLSLLLLPKKLGQRRAIQKSKTASNDYIASIITWDLPPNAGNLRRLRTIWRKLFPRSR